MWYWNRPRKDTFPFTGAQYYLQQIQLACLVQDSLLTQRSICPKIALLALGLFQFFEKVVYKIRKNVS
jgi:hypothetical protein